MATSGGPNIITDGLVLHLDAANTKSYSGGGNTWSDLSGNGNDGTLINGPIFNENGTFTFDGSNDYVEVHHNFLKPETTNIRESITVSIFCKSDGSSSSGWNMYWSGVSKYSQFILGPNGIGGKMAFVVNSGGWYPSGYSGDIWGQESIDIREYHYYTGTYNKSSGMLTLYVDGNLEADFNVGIFTLTNDPNSFSLNKRDVSGNHLKSTNSIFHIYNRALTQSEVLQNYNATRSRFGL